MRLTFRALTLVMAMAVSLTPFWALAAEEPCPQALLSPQAQTRIRQTLNWEATANNPDYRQSPQPVSMRAARVIRSKTEIRVAKGAPQALVEMFVGENTILWPRHPFLKAQKIEPIAKKLTLFGVQKDLLENYAGQPIPYAQEPQQFAFSGYLTASRSIAFQVGSTWGSIKLPTDFPHPAHHQRLKLSVHQDIDAAIGRANLISDIESHHGPDPVLILLPDVLSVKDRATGNGFLVRDLSKISSPKFSYLPAFSIPFTELVSLEYYAALSGQAKARLLIKYGLTLESPNPQNWLLELDDHLKPTGRIVFRDLSDSFLYAPVLNALGWKQDPLSKELPTHHTNLNQKTIGTQFMRMNNKLTEVESQAHHERLSALHLRYFLAEARRLLGVEKNKLDSISQLNEFLPSREGQAALQKAAQTSYATQLVNLEEALEDYQRHIHHGWGRYTMLITGFESGKIVEQQKFINEILRQEKQFLTLVPRHTYWQHPPPPQAQGPKRSALSVREVERYIGQEIFGISAEHGHDIETYRGILKSVRLRIHKSWIANINFIYGTIESTVGQGVSEVLLWSDLSTVSVESYVANVTPPANAIQAATAKDIPTPPSGPPRSLPTRPFFDIPM